jgi:hypothetical protein
MFRKRSCIIIYRKAADVKAGTTPDPAGARAQRAVATIMGPILEMHEGEGVDKAADV